MWEWKVSVLVFCAISIYILNLLASISYPYLIISTNSQNINSKTASWLTRTRFLVKPSMAYIPARTETRLDMNSMHQDKF